MTLSPKIYHCAPLAAVLWVGLSVAPPLAAWGVSAISARAETAAEQATEAPAANAFQARLFAGAISDPVLGLSERYGPLAFNAVGAEMTARYGGLRFSATLAKIGTGQDSVSGWGDSSNVPLYNLSYGFGANDWRVGFGKRTRHWSPSATTSLFLSRNAPAFHAAYMEKTGDTAIDLPVLRALGPWKAEFFVGTTSDSGQPDNARIMGMRLQIRPARGLELDFIRTAQWGGAGYASGGGAFWDVLTGSTNEGPAANANQMAGFGVSYRPPVGQENWRVYGQLAGEDEAGGLPSCLFYLAGVSLDTQTFGVPTTVALETVDTRTEQSANGFCGANSAYNNAVYSYAHKGQVLGAALDSQGRSIGLNVSHEFNQLSVDWSLRHILVNEASAASHRLSSRRVEGTVAMLRAVRPFGSGQIEGILAYQGVDLNKVGSPKSLRAGVGMSLDF